MTAIVQQTDTDDFILTPAEAWEVFDSHVRQAMPGVTGEEFVLRWNAGEFAGDADRPGHRHIMRFALMIPRASHQPQSALSPASGASPRDQ